MDLSRILYLVLAAMGGIACANGTSGDERNEDREQDRSNGAPIPPPPKVYLTPLNGTTDVFREGDNTSPYAAATGPAIQSSFDQPMERAQLEKLAGRAVIVSDATREVLNVDMLYVERGNRFNFVELIPKTAPAEGWYTLEAPKPEPPYVWPDAQAQEDGSARTRFRVGSAPFVTSISVCEKADGRTAVDLYTSEVVAPREPLSEHLHVEANGEQLGCEMSAMAGSIRALCNGAGGDAIRVILNDAFSSVPKPTLPISEATATFDLVLSAGQLTDNDHCKRFTQELPQPQMTTQASWAFWAHNMSELRAGTDLGVLATVESIEDMQPTEALLPRLQRLTIVVNRVMWQAGAVEAPDSLSFLYTVNADPPTTEGDRWILYLQVYESGKYRAVGPTGWFAVNASDIVMPLPESPIKLPDNTSIDDFAKLKP
jgi:hypothetical protein